MKALKISTLLFIILIISNTIVSQINVYKPFPQAYASWIVQDWSQITSGGFNSWKKYEVTGDTIIGSYTYKKVTSANNTGYPIGSSFPYIIPFGPRSFSFCYRNDATTKKVYYLVVTGGINKDTLWYDFNLNIGDTVKSTYSYQKHPYYGPTYGTAFNRVVQSIDSSLICGTYYKRFKFNCGDNESCLIEGVGFMDNFIHTWRDNECPFEPVELFYTHVSTCEPTGINEASITKNNIHIYPNPVTSDFKINTTLTLSYYTILNNLGEIVQQGKCTNQESILFSEYLNGLYLISMQDERGNTYHTKFIKQ